MIWGFGSCSALRKDEFIVSDEDSVAAQALRGLQFAEHTDEAKCFLAVTLAKSDDTNSDTD